MALPRKRHTTEMIIYEVNLFVEPSIQSEFEQWLAQHVEEMLAIPGFIKAKLMRVLEGALTDGADEGVTDRIPICVHYQLADQDALARYLADQAATMRADGVSRFGDKFSACRRVLGPMD